jgi:large subunit ribosomal protein L9
LAQAVLLKDVEGLGEAGTPVDVSPGYLRNYLIPRKLAAPATPGALEQAQRRQAAAEKAEKARAEREEQAASLLSKTVLTIYQRAGEDGKLFGSVTSAEIADAIQAARGIRVDRKKIRLEEPIRETGTFMVDVEVGGGVTASVKTIVAEMREGPD